MLFSFFANSNQGPVILISANFGPNLNFNLNFQVETDGRGVAVRHVQMHGGGMNIPQSLRSPRAYGTRPCSAVT